MTKPNEKTHPSTPGSKPGGPSTPLEEGAITVSHDNQWNEKVQRGRALVTEINDRKWELGDLANEVVPAGANGVHNSDVLGEFAAEIGITAETLRRIAGVDRMSAEPQAEIERLTAVLGAVAALADRYVKEYGEPDPKHRFLIDDFLDDLRPLLAPVSGAVAKPDLTRERAFPNFDALHDYLLHLNEQGIPPDVSGYDKNGSPIVVWLDEEGGDATHPLALTLGGEDAAHPEPDRHDAARLAFPVLILDVSTPAVAKREQEVRAAEVQRRLVAEWHADQCGCKGFATDGDGDLSECDSRAKGFNMHNPQSWTVEEVLTARADALTEGPTS